MFCSKSLALYPWAIQVSWFLQCKLQTVKSTYPRASRRQRAHCFPFLKLKFAFEHLLCKLKYCWGDYLQKKRKKKLKNIHIGHNYYPHKFTSTTELTYMWYNEKLWIPTKWQVQIGTLHPRGCMRSTTLLIAKGLENYPVQGTLDNNKAFILITFLLAQWMDIKSNIAKQISLSTPQETEMLFC